MKINVKINKSIFILFSFIVLFSNLRPVSNIVQATTISAAPANIVQATTVSAAPTNIVVPQTPSFGDLVVRYATRMCNNDFYNVFRQDGRDFIDFWMTAHDATLDLERGYTCMRLFYNNIKSCDLIDFSVVDHVSRIMPQFLERYFEKKRSSSGEFNVMKEKIEDCLLDNFAEKLDKFQLEPDIFISDLSLNLTNLVKSRISLVKQEEDENEFREKMRNIIIRFLDVSINKLVWYEDMYETIWSSFKSISNNLYNLGLKNIINDQDNLDELWDSLVRRFVWFLKEKGSVLPIELYKQIEEDLRSDVVFCLAVGEQDQNIKTKKEMIAEAVVRAKAQAIAFEKQGLIADEMINHPH